MAAVALAAPTSADARNYVKSMNLELSSGEVRILSSDGETYDRIQDGDVAFSAELGIDLRHPGALDAIAIHLGECTGHHGECYTKPLIFSTAGSGREFSTDHPLTFAVPSSRIATIDMAQTMFAICNGKRDETAGAGGDIPAQLDIGATLAVDTRISHLKPIPHEPGAGLASHGLGLGEYSKTHPIPFKLKLACAPLPTRIKAPPQPFSVDVFVQQGGDTCPKLTELKARIKYQVPTTSRFRFKVDGKPSKWFNVKADKVGDVYQVEHSKTYHLDPGQHHFRVEAEGGKKSAVRTLTVDCPPFQATSMWLTLKTENKSTCPKNVDATVRINGNRPGAALTKIKNQAGVVMAIESIKVEREGDQYVGRLTKTFNMTAIDTMLIAEDANDSANNSGWQPLKIECLEALSGKLTLNSLGDTSCEGEALVAMHTNGAGELPYELECGPGKSWQRKVTAMANKIGVDKVGFDVSNNEQVTCVLRTRIGGVLKSLDGASTTFQCHKPIDTGTSDLTPELPPGDPPVVGPTLTGDFSFVDTGGTRCPRQGKALINFKTSKPDNVHWSLDCTNGHFSGVAQTAPSPQGGFIAPALAPFDVKQTTHAKCALKTVAPGKPKVHTLKGHLFQCVGRTDVGGPEDLTPDTPSDPQKPGTAVVDPVKPEKPDRPSTAVVDPLRPTISCAGGSVNDGACICARTIKPVKAGNNAWRCVVDAGPDRPTVSEPKISCASGTLKNGACTCARTHKPVKAGQNAWRCIKTVVIDPPRNKDGANKANKFEVKTAPNKTAQPKLGNADKAKGGKGKGKAAKKGNGASALR